MTRVLIQYILPLILPAAVFALWVLLTRKRRGAVAPALQRGPWFWLILGGVALMTVTLVVVAYTSGGGPGSTYIAPRYEDGRVVPGRIE